MKCAVRANGQRAEGKALLETTEIIFRSDSLRLKIPFARMKSVKVVGGELRVQSPEGAVCIRGWAAGGEMGPQDLNPKSRMEKLGVKEGAKVTVIGNWKRSLRRS